VLRFYEELKGVETGAGGLSIRRVSEYCYPPARVRYR